MLTNINIIISLRNTIIVIFKGKQLTNICLLITSILMSKLTFDDSKVSFDRLQDGMKQSFISIRSNINNVFLFRLLFITC